MRPMLLAIMTAATAALSAVALPPISFLDALLIYSITGQTLLILALFTGALLPERS